LCVGRGKRWAFPWHGNCRPWRIDGVQETPVNIAPPSAAGSATYRWSAVIFHGFALLIIVDTVLAGMFNPDRGQVGFWLEVVVFLGGLFAWAAWIGRRLLRGSGVVAAIAFLSVLSASALIGMLVTLAGFLPPDAPFPGMGVMIAARTIFGLYVLLAWGVLLWEWSRRRAGPRRPTGPLQA
jgi:hypothetical protein